MYSPDNSHHPNQSEDFPRLTVEAPKPAKERDPLEEFREWEACFEKIAELWEEDKARSTEDAQTLLAMRSFGKEGFFTQESAASFAQHLPQGMPTMMLHAFSSPMFLTAVCMMGGEMLNLDENTPEQDEIWKDLESRKDSPGVICMIKWALDREEDANKQKVILERLKTNRIAA